MNCKDVDQVLAAGTVADGRGDVRAHLASCPKCRLAQAIYVEIDRALDSGGTWTPPPGFARRIASRTAMSSSPRARTRLSFRLPPLALAGVSCALAMTVGVVSLDPAVYARATALLAENNLVVSWVSAAGALWLAAERHGGILD